MPKEIDESKLNYNKYPGEHVVEYDGVVTIGGDKTFHLVMNFRDGFKADKLEQRFSEILDKYDYIVGDWGFEQLRLKGFFSSSRKNMMAENKIDRLEDYLNEFCNYGAPYFVLRRIRAKDLKREAFISERAVDLDFKGGRANGNSGKAYDKPRRNRGRNRNRKPRENDFDKSVKNSDKPERFDRPVKNPDKNRTNQKADRKNKRDFDSSNNRRNGNGTGNNNNQNRKGPKRDFTIKTKDRFEDNRHKTGQTKSDRFDSSNRKGPKKFDKPAPKPASQGFVIRSRGEK